MANRTARQIFFVCAAASNGDLITKTIAALSPGEASDLFLKEFEVAPQEIMGPFYKKKTQILETTRELKFSNQVKKAIYNDWVVNAFLLKEPVDQAYLVFIKRVDNKKLPLPKGIITVHTNQLKDIF
jgi:hypothetical protein